jgi:hypothetical protein
MVMQKETHGFTMEMELKPMTIPIMFMVEDITCMNRHLIAVYKITDMIPHYTTIHMLFPKIPAMETLADRILQLQTFLYYMA